MVEAQGYPIPARAKQWILKVRMGGKVNLWSTAQRWQSQYSSLKKYRLQRREGLRGAKALGERALLGQTTEQKSQGLLHPLGNLWIA
jgi:hypothetical protein